MWPFLYTIKKQLDDEIGNPTRLIQLIRSNPSFSSPLPIPNPSIAIQDMIQWDQWYPSSYASYGDIRISKVGYPGFGSPINRKDLANLTECETTDNWHCPIRQVEGLLASKSDLTKFLSIDDFATTISPELISDVTLRGILKSLAHGEIRILRDEYDRKSDFFIRYPWDSNRIFLINSGGSHHFSAARYLAYHLDYRIVLTGKLKTYRLIPEAVRTLTNDFDLYSVPKSLFNGLSDVLHDFSAPFGIYSLPRPYHNHTMILLPRDNERSIKASSVMRKHGTPNIADLINLSLNKQYQNERRFILS